VQCTRTITLGNLSFRVFNFKCNPLRNKFKITQFLHCVPNPVSFLQSEALVLVNLLSLNLLESLNCTDISDFT